MKTKDLTKMAICIALLSVSSYLSFPLPFTPTMVTAQTIMINVSSLLLTPQQVFITVMLYLLMGLLGFPVFAGGGSGLAYIVSPSGGFLLAFLIAAPVISLMRQKVAVNFKRYLQVTVFIGMPIIYFIGAVWMSVVTHMGLIATLNAAVLPFVIGDTLKCIIASTLALRLERLTSSTKWVTCYE